jgi:hypothetical protein
MRLCSRAICALAAALSWLSGSSPLEAAAPEKTRDVVFEGMCDASGAVALDDQFFAVADDEDNVLRIYAARIGGSPVGSSDLSGSLNLPEKGKKKKKKKKAKHQPRIPEADVEAATRLGETALWLTSHGRTESGKLRPERFRFFATTATSAADLIEVIGRPYEGLADDMIDAQALAGLGLDDATRLPAKEGGLDIEGMTARPEGGVIIGLRSPLIDRKAIVVSIENPIELMTEGRPRFGKPMLIELGGSGVRALSWWRGRYWILAGDGRSSRLFTWRPPEKPQLVAVDLGDLNAEAFFSPEETDELLVLSDDGGREIDGKACKKLKDETRKRFRGRWLRPDVGR